MGKAVIVKHSIKLTELVTFKERYRHIPPHHFENVKNIYRKCWPLEPLENHAAPGLAQLYWCKRRKFTLLHRPMQGWSRMPIAFLTKTKP